LRPVHEFMQEVPMGYKSLWEIRGQVKKNGQKIQST